MLIRFRCVVDRPLFVCVLWTVAFNKQNGGGYQNRFQGNGYSSNNGNRFGGQNGGTGYRNNNGGGGGFRNSNNSNFNRDSWNNKPNVGLSKVEWGSKTLSPFTKNFYVPHPDVANRSSFEVDQYRVSKEIMVEGEAPNPIQHFSETNFPDHVMDQIVSQGYEVAHGHPGPRLAHRDERS
ncbi:hypothetical protein NQ317_010661 [Molorchus minor]|uniref:Uncharacterized protein n=1 Tax=Molorchus minor TaxID=1323400 RepID=A0ABQ9K6X7_9CUCU|nr:hypothetical protein NQ317_010661 [Molorchus minor]